MVVVDDDCAAAAVGLSEARISAGLMGVWRANGPRSKGGVSEEERALAVAPLRASVGAQGNGELEL